MISPSSRERRSRLAGPMTSINSGWKTTTLRQKDLRLLRPRRLHRRRATRRPIISSRPGLLGFGRSQEDENAASVLRPRGFVVPGIHRAIFAVTDGDHLSSVHSVLNQIFAQRQRTPLTQGAVIFFGPALVAVALDLHRVTRIGFQVIGHGGNLALFVGLHHRAVKIKMDRVGLKDLSVASVISEIGGIDLWRAGLLPCRRRVGNPDAVVE